MAGLLFVQSRRVRAGLASAAVAWTATPALAHVTDAAGGGFAAGLSHPVGGLDHVLAMVAVGLWGAQLGRPLVWSLPIAFPLMMAVGASIGLTGYPLPLVEVGIAASAIALGLMVLLDVKLPVPAAIGIVAFFAIFHGHAHGTELPQGQSGVTYSLGFVISTGLLHAVGIGIGTIHRWDVGKIALRGAGACVLLGGLFFLGSSVGLIA